MKAEHNVEASLMADGGSKGILEILGILADGGSTGLNSEPAMAQRNLIIWTSLGFWKGAWNDVIMATKIQKQKSKQPVGFISFSGSTDFSTV